MPDIPQSLKDHFAVAGLSQEEIATITSRFQTTGYYHDGDCRAWGEPPAEPEPAPVSVVVNVKVNGEPVPVTTPDAPESILAQPV